MEIEKYQSTETIITHGDQTKPYIYYTVDDCSNLDTVEGFLNIAQEKGVHITFFHNLRTFPVSGKLAMGKDGSNRDSCKITKPHDTSLDHVR